jgi:HAD superfamily hydrolase (TIGR01549 family)
MIEAVLFDLDDTLLGNSLEVFLPRYFDLISQYASPYVERREFLRALRMATDAVVKDAHSDQTNFEVFWHHFEAQTGLSSAEMLPFFERFYRTEFTRLQTVTQQIPEAASLVESCLAQGRKVIIATNPLFPAVAIETRLAWAGVPVTNHDYHLVTAMENMHAAKPQTYYYEEILQKIDCSPDRTLMVGDNWLNDIKPAAAVGLHTYWIADPRAVAPEAKKATARGSLADLLRRVNEGWLDDAGGRFAE